MNLRVAKTSCILLFSAALAGCGGRMFLEETSIPTPLVDQIPMHVGLKIHPEMYTFSRKEEVLERHDWEINMGDANANLFVNLFGHMFETVTLVGEDDDPATMALDALVETSIDAFEFSIPEQTGTDSFAIWIRYRLKVFNSDGELVANWPVSAYGKSESRAMKSGASLETAAVLAMRDAAALMVMKLDRETGISALAAQREQSEPEAAPIEAALPDNTSSFSPGGG